VNDLTPYGAWYTKPDGSPSPCDDPAAAIAAARERLASMRQNPGPHPSGLRGLARAALFLGAGSQVVVAAIYLGIVQLLPDSGHQYTNVATHLLLAACFVGMGIWMIKANSHVALAPELAFRRWITRSIGAGRGAAYRGLHALEQSGRPRTLTTEKGATEQFSFETPNGFERYWLTAFGSAIDPWKRCKFAHIQRHEIAPDLCLMQAEVRVAFYRLAPMFMANLPLFGGIILSVVMTFVFAFVAASNQGDVNLPLWIGLIAAPTVLGLLVALAMTIRAMVADQHKVLVLRKLLIRLNGHWRIFNGEIQAPEETDISWLNAS
jgi:hypothetical protein